MGRREAARARGHLSTTRRSCGEGSYPAGGLGAQDHPQEGRILQGKALAERLRLSARLISPTISADPRIAKMTSVPPGCVTWA